MPQRDLCAYLQDVLDAIGAIRYFIGSKSYEGFVEDDLVRSGVERKFEIIGEALKQAEIHYPEQLKSLSHIRGASAQRNAIVHGYFVVDPSYLWLSIEKDFPDLVSEVEALKAQVCPQQI